MFANPNWEASVCQKLSQVQQGSNSVDTVIQQFELHSPSSKLGDAGLINKFEQAISYHLCQAIYGSFPLPETWREWKERASVINNQQQCFDHTQLQFCQG